MQYEKIIAITPRRLGDTMFRLPVFRLLKKKYPSAKIDVIARTQLAAEVLENNPNINKIFISPGDEEVKILKNDYDLIINLDDEKNSRAMAAQFNGTVISGFQDEFAGKHQTEKVFYYFAKQLGLDSDEIDLAYDLYPDEAHFKYIQSFFDDSKSSYIGFHLGCHSLAKKSKNLFGFLSHPKAWSLDHFIVLAKLLIKHDPSVKIVLTGAKDEIKIAEYFMKKIPNTISFVGKTSVLEAAALMSFLKLLITNDTGMLHVACSTNVPLIVLCGDQTDYRITGPFPKNAKRIILYKNKINDITPKEVFESAVVIQ